MKAKGPKRASRWLRILSLALMAGAWIAKDFVAASLDEARDEAQQVLTQKEAHESRQEQSRKQNEADRLLTSIEARLRIREDADKRQDELKELIEELNVALELKSFEEEGDLLEANANTLKTLGGQIALEANKRLTLMKVADEEMETGKELVALAAALGGKKPDELTDQDEEKAEALATKYEKSNRKLSEEYEVLHKAAEDARDQSAEWAKVFRSIAWLSTLLAAMMVGDWRKVLLGEAKQLAQGSAEETEEPATSAGGGAEP